MPMGITPQEFVKNVYYVQENVLLDFWPSDDKYKEVLVQANMVYKEIQREWSWSCYREQYVLGSTTDPEGPGAIPAYELPKWIYKVNVFPDDCVRLYKPRSCHRHGNLCLSCDEGCYSFDERNFIEVPFVSTSQRHHRKSDHVSIGGQHFTHKPLGAILWGQEVHFNRPLLPHERHRIAVTDIVRRVPQLHICDHTCTDKDGNTPSYLETDYRPCDKIETSVFGEMPDLEDYMIVRTAALHCVGSPPAAMKKMDLDELARGILTDMRNNDQQYNEPDTVDRDFGLMTIDHIGGAGIGYSFSGGYYPTRGNGYY